MTSRQLVEWAATARIGDPVPCSGGRPVPMDTIWRAVGTMGGYGDPEFPPAGTPITPASAAAISRCAARVLADEG
jgi:hypothetical protein